MATRRKQVKKPTQFQRLADAGVLDATFFSEEEKHIINRMPRREVDVLIRMRRERGPAPSKNVRPNIIL